MFAITMFALISGAVGADSLDLDSTLATIMWFVELAGIVVGALAMLRRALASGEDLDLKKTLEAAEDAAARLNDHIKTMPKETRDQLDDLESEARKTLIGQKVARAVKHVEDIRGKALSGKLLRKARERILTRLDLPTPLDDA